jgi:hypothetical protein
MGDSNNGDKACRVEKAAKAEPEKFGAIAEKMYQTGKVYRTYRKLREVQGEEFGSINTQKRTQYPTISIGMMHAENSIRQLERIDRRDLHFEEAINYTIQRAQEMLVDHMLPGQSKKFCEAIRQEEAGPNCDVALMLMAVEKAVTSVATMGGVNALADSWKSSDPRDLARQLSIVAKTLRQWAKTIGDLHQSGKKG